MKKKKASDESRPRKAKPLAERDVFMLTLPKRFQEPLKTLAKQNFRTLTGEVAAIVGEKLRELGLLGDGG